MDLLNVLLLMSVLLRFMQKLIFFVCLFFASVASVFPVVLLGRKQTLDVCYNSGAKILVPSVLMK